jgi:hypothetical protein
MSSLVVASDE